MTLNDDGQLDELLRTGLLADKILQVQSVGGPLTAQARIFLESGDREIGKILNGEKAATSPRISAAAIDDLALYSQALPVVIQIGHWAQPIEQAQFHKEVRKFLEEIQKELRAAATSGAIPAGGLPQTHLFFAAWARETLRRSSSFFEEKTELTPWRSQRTFHPGLFSA